MDVIQQEYEEVPNMIPKVIPRTQITSISIDFMGQISTRPNFIIGENLEPQFDGWRMSPISVVDKACLS